MSQLGHFLLVADGEGLAMRCALASLVSFALRTGRRNSAFRLRVEPPFRVFFIPNNTRQKIKHPFGCLIFCGGWGGIVIPTHSRSWAPFDCATLRHEPGNLRCSA